MANPNTIAEQEVNTSLPPSPIRTSDPRLRRLKNRLQTFPRLTNLPIEIQMQIWRYAALPCGAPKLYNVFSPSKTSERTSFQLSWNRTARDNMYYYRTEGLNVGVMRRKLMATCKLSRLVAMEIWVKIVRGIDVESAHGEHKEEHRMGRADIVERLKALREPPFFSVELLEGY